MGAARKTNFNEHVTVNPKWGSAGRMKDVGGKAPEKPGQACDFEEAEGVKKGRNAENKVRSRRQASSWTAMQLS